MDNVEAFVEKYVAFDIPVKYLNLEIYPVKTKNYYDFVENYNILKIEKNKIPDIKIIQMSYLEYLFNLICANEDLKNNFLMVLELSFNIIFSKDNMIDYNDPITNEEFKKGQIVQLLDRDTDIVRFYINGYNVEFIVDDKQFYLILSGIKVSSRQFDDIIRIIFYQNSYNYDDTPMSADFEKIVTQYYSIKNKGLIFPSVEDKLVDIMSQTGFKKKDLCEMPIRTVDKLLATIQAKIDYQIAHTYNTINNPRSEIDGWVVKKKKERYSEVFSDASEIEDKFK